MQKISLMKRAMTFIMAFAILMVFNGTTALASSVSSVPENESAETEFGASITYNAQTGEVIYGMDQENGTMEVGNVINLEHNENSGISTQGIIGTDDRTLVSNPTGDPYRRPPLSLPPVPLLASRSQDPPYLDTTAWHDRAYPSPDCQEKSPALLPAPRVRFSVPVLLNTCPRTCSTPSRIRIPPSAPSLSQSL